MSDIRNQKASDLVNFSAGVIDRESSATWEGFFHLERRASVDFTLITHISQHHRSGKYWQALTRIYSYGFLD